MLWFSNFILNLILWLTTECADAVVVEEKLLQLQAAVQPLHFRDVIIIKGSPAQVDQFIQIDQLGNPLAVKVQGSDLVKIQRHKHIKNVYNIEDVNHFNS